MSRACCDLPTNIKDLFPKENLKFAAGITEAEGNVLKQVFAEHDCFERVGEMIDAARPKCPVLADKMQNVLDENRQRLEGLSPEAVEFCKKVIAYVTKVQCFLTLGKELTEVCHAKANEIHKAFHDLSPSDQADIQKNNPDVKFN